MVQAAFFNIDNSMVVSTDPVWLQTAFNILMVIFDQVGLQTNTRKTVGVVFQPCRAVRVWSEKAYKCWMAVERRSYQDRKQERFQCP